VKKKKEENIPIALVKTEGTGGGEGVGAALQGSRPSYVEAASGFSSTKLPPKLTEEEIPYACVGRGALNIIVEEDQRRIELSLPIPEHRAAEANLKWLGAEPP
jgi:hypothetical protein